MAASVSLPLAELERCPSNASEAARFASEHALLRGLQPDAAQHTGRRSSSSWGAAPLAIESFPCVGSSGRLSLPLAWGDPPERQVPLFIRWEDYAAYLPPRLEKVTFVQVGANCGKNTYGCAVGGDPIWSYATSCGWRGIAVEPVSYVFLNLCKNYRRWSHRVMSLRGAVSDAGPSLMTIGLGGGETNKLLRRGSRWRRQNESVPVVDLHGLWRHARAHLRTTSSARPTVDILVVDAEGAEPNILLGVSPGHASSSTTTTAGSSAEPSLAARPLPRPLPSLILFEHAHLSRSLTTIHAHLTSQGCARHTD